MAMAALREGDGSLEDGARVLALRLPGWLRDWGADAAAADVEVDPDLADISFDSDEEGGSARGRGRGITGVG